MRFRGSFQRAVRAPNILELYSARLRQITLQLPQNKNGYYDPCAGPTPAASLTQCERTGVTAAEYGNISDYNFFPQMIGGNPDLKPETAKTYSYGGVFTPSFIPNLQISVDYYHIVVDQLISTISPTLSLTSCLNTGDPYFCSLIHRGAGGTLFSTNDAYILSTNVNTGQLMTDGIDVSSSYRLPLPAMFHHDGGNLEFGLSGTYVRQYKLKPLPTSTAAQTYDCAGYYEYNCGAPRPKWRHNLEATWNTSYDLSVSATWRYISHVELSRASSQPALVGTYAPIDKFLGSVSYMDVSAAYRWNIATFRVGVNNLLDKDPPTSTIVSSTAGGNGNTYPQFYDTLGRVIFGTMSVQF
jgi:outer membrane receptor protein involved in Fe transport